MPRPFCILPSNSASQGAPPITRTTAPLSVFPPTIQTTMAADTGKVYQIKVPANTKPGEELKLKFPGRTEKVVIKLPEGAEPGKVIQFTVPPEGAVATGDGIGDLLGAAVASGKGETDHAAILIQSRLRGKSARNLKLSKTNTVPDTGEVNVTEAGASSSSGTMTMLAVLIAMAAAAYYAYTEGHLDDLLQLSPPPPPPPAKKMFGIF
jgi:hypothetical protein